MTVVHTLFDGESLDLTLDELFPDGSEQLEGEVENTTRGVLAATSTIASSVKQALADHFDRPLTEFDSYNVQLETNGNITCRPKANFGG